MSWAYSYVGSCEVTGSAAWLGYQLVESRTEHIVAVSAPQLRAQLPATR